MNILNKRTALIIFNVGVVLIVIGLVLQIKVLLDKIQDQKELIDIQASQIIQCNEEESGLYGAYLQLEEENMTCWNMYYSGVSEYEGEYEYYE
jgi:hypothetical protein